MNIHIHLSNLIGLLPMNIAGLTSLIIVAIRNIAGACALLLIAQVGQAESLTRKLDSVTFQDGTSATGYITFDTAALNVSDFYIMTTTNGLFPGYIYDPSSTSKAEIYHFSDSPDWAVYFYGLNTSSPPYHALQFSFVESPFNGAIRNLAIGSSDGRYLSVESFTNEYYSGQFRRVSNGSLNIVAVSSLFNVTPSALWPPNNKLVKVTVTPIPSDLLGCQITSISANDLITTADYRITSPLTVELKATKKRNGLGRIYTVELSCLHSSYEVTGNVMVPVLHDQGKSRAKLN